MAPDSGEASCSSQPARMITVNSLEFLLSLRWAAITLKLSFKPLIMFPGEWKEPRELNSHSRLKGIITPLRQFQTWAFNTPEDYYNVTMSICGFFFYHYHCVYYLQQDQVLYRNPEPVPRAGEIRCEWRGKRAGSGWFWGILLLTTSQGWRTRSCSHFVL